jgi:hypothetical protein
VLDCRVLATTSSTPAALHGAPDQEYRKNAAATEQQQQRQQQRSLLKPEHLLKSRRLGKRASDETQKVGDALVAKLQQRRHCTSMA